MISSISIDSPGLINDLSYRKINNAHYFGYPCPTKTKCAPFKVVFEHSCVAFVELWGAQGGSARSSTNSPGGKGGYASGKFIFRENIPYYFYIGAMGEPIGQATFGGGGKGSSRSGDGNGLGGGSGGGATDIRLMKGDSEEALKSRLIVAAGGAGSEVYYAAIPGGFGGGEYGGNASKKLLEGGSYIVEGVGASPFMGGLSHNGNRSQLGKATDDCDKSYGSGGGGGYYGGGSGGDDYCVVFSAGGGSSFISGIEPWNTTFYNGKYYRFSKGKTIPGNENIPTRFNIKNDSTKLDGLLKLTILSTIFTSKITPFRTLLFIQTFILSS